MELLNNNYTTIMYLETFTSVNGCISETYPNYSNLLSIDSLNR